VDLMQLGPPWTKWPGGCLCRLLLLAVYLASLHCAAGAVFEISIAVCSYVVLRSARSRSRGTCYRKPVRLRESFVVKRETGQTIS
jgi:hypothetical protein